MVLSFCRDGSFRSVRQDTRTGLVALVAIVAVVTGGGCATVARSMAKGIATRTVERELTLPGVPSQPELEAYRRCVSTRGGICHSDPPPGAPSHPVTPLVTKLPAGQVSAASGTLAAVAERFAREFLDHPVQHQVNALYNRVQGVPRDQLPASYQSETPTIVIPLKSFDEYLQLAEAATALGGWDAVATGLMSRRDESSRMSLYIAEYLRAYFRDGRFFQFSLTTQGLVNRIKEQLKKTLPLLDDEQIDDLAKQLIKEYLNLEPGDNGQYPDVPIFGKLGAGGFVARGGKGYQFPSIEAKLDPTSARKVTVSRVDFVASGSDVLRVIIHAIADAKAGLPAVTNATGTVLSQDPLVTNKPGMPGHLTEEKFGEVEIFADRLEGLTGAAVGRAIRGLGWVALNNEALANLIETVVAVSVRKVGETLAWCWFSCGLDRGGRPTLADVQPLTVRMRLTGAEQLIE